MIQLLVILSISWAVLWYLEKKDLSVLGMYPTEERWKYSSILFLASGIISAGGFWLRMLFIKEEYVLSPDVTFASMAMESWYQIRSVMTEELLCRGALLYLLIQKIGQQKAILITSIFFAGLHGLNVGFWENWISALLTLTFTFGMGLLLAYAFARTRCLLYPFAIHFGWNLVQNYFFPDTANGHHLFSLLTPPPEVTISYLAYFTMLFLPKIGVIVMGYLIIRLLRKVD